MIHDDLSTKRQLLADVFDGKTDKLRTYKSNQQRIISPYRWLVVDEIAGTMQGIDRLGGSHPLSSDELTNLSSSNVWRIVDYSGGLRIPEPDER